MSLPLGKSMPHAYRDQDVLSPLRIAFFSCEGAALVLGVISNAVFTYVLRNTQTFHRNLRILWYNMVVSHMLITLTRGFMLSDRFLHWIPAHVLFVISIGHDTGVGLFVSNQLVLVIERGFSTYLLQKYVKKFNCLFPIFLVTSAWLLALAWSISYWMSKFNQQRPLELSLATHKAHSAFPKTHMTPAPCLAHNIVTVNIMFGVDLVSVSVFMWILCVSRKQFKTKTLSNGNSLATRYTISENLRAAKVIKHMITINVAVQLAGAIILLIIVFAFLPRHRFYEYRIAANVFDLVLACYIVFFPVHLSLSHPEMHKILRCRIFGKPKVATVNVQTLRNVNGDQLIYRETQQQYFASLRLQWDSKVPQAQREQ